MEFSTRIALKSSSRLALRPRICPGCSYYKPLPSTHSGRQARQFTTTPSRNAVGQQRAGGGQLLGRQVMSQMGEANSTRMKGIAKSRQPNDLGLFPRTFIREPWHKYLPMLTTAPKLWLRIQGLILKRAFQHNFGCVFLRPPPFPIALELTDEQIASFTTSPGHVASECASFLMHLSTRSRYRFTIRLGFAMP